MPKVPYKEIYFDILSRLNILPEDPASDTGATLYTLDDLALDAAKVTPADPAYNPLEIFVAILDAESEAINAFFSVTGHGRKGGEFGAEADPGFVAMEVVNKQGAILPARIGKLAGVEVAEKATDIEANDIVWVVADPAAMSLVSDYNPKAKLLGLDEIGVFDALYATNDDETKIWFSGEACRVTFCVYQRRAAPKNVAELIEALKAPCPAPEELISSIKDIALGAITPREGEMTGAGAYFTNRGRSGLSREQIKHQTKPPLVIGQKTDS